MFIRKSLCSVVFVGVATLGYGQSATGFPPVWFGYGGNPQHTSVSRIPGQPLSRIVWQTPVDLDPQYSGTDLLIHYGCPSITGAGTILLAVKTGATDGFEFDARREYDGAMIWSEQTGYSLPSHDWTPSVSGVLMYNNVYAMPSAAGGITFRSNPDSPIGTSNTFYFYGNANYNSDPLDFDNVKICTPLTSDPAGNVYFGYRVEGSTPLGLVSGIAKVNENGNATFVTAAQASGDPNITQVAMNCAPAVNLRDSVVYIAVNGDGGYLVGLTTQGLNTLYKVLTRDPVTGNSANVDDDGTASPMIGPDGDVYFGVLENPWYSNNDRGWMLHYDQTLHVKGAPGAFGWDDTGSIVPSFMVPSYKGSSRYLVLTKYNNYAGIGTGNGHNKVGVLDPLASMTDPVSGATVMKEVITVLGETPDPNFPTFPGAVREWCINSAAIDPYHRCAYVNSEDGSLYRWNFATNTLDEKVVLTSGVGEAYTPTLIGRMGTVFAINNATLFAVR